MRQATIHVGDSLEVLRTLPDESVHCVVTSPPYWGLRDYGVDGQIGMEASFPEFLEVLVRVFAEVRRVLRPDGTCWVNMGDSYASAGGGGQGPGGALAGRGVNGARRGADTRSAAKPKDMIGQPWRLAFALQEQGWWLRSDIIWHKPSPMPESVTDRPSKAHEYVFLLTKSAHYHYDADAVRTPLKDKTRTTYTSSRQAPETRDENVKSRNFAMTMPDRKPRLVTGHGVRPGDHKGGNQGNGFITYQEAGANLRTVWTVASAPFKEAHFAVFPPKLVEPCIKAGCPLDGLVLDPFAGAGTTGLVALGLGRQFIGIELNPVYAEMARRRIRESAPLLNRVEVAS